MVLLAQCAPQCTPAMPAPSSPPTVVSYDLTGAVPTDASTIDITPDGRYVSYSGTRRLDLTTWYSEETNGRLLIGDGWGVIDDWSDTSVALYEFTSGTALLRAELPFGWALESIDSTSRNGERVGVSAVNGAFAGTAAFLLDLRQGWALRLDQYLAGHDLTATASYGALVSGDGQSAAFSYQDGPVGCTACVDVWWFRNDAVSLASPTAAGGTSNNGDSDPVDISGDGRYVLFHSTALDLAGGPVSSRPQGQLLVRDVIGGTTSIVAGLGGIGNPFAAAISDDGTKVALPVDRLASGGPYTFAAVYDSTTHLTTVLTPVDRDHVLSSSSYLAMSANGGRIAFDVMLPNFENRHLVVDLAY
jgi:hypothetical protein